MIENLPFYIPLTFGLTTLATLFLFYNALRKSSDTSVSGNAIKITVGLVLWLILQVVLSMIGVYSENLNSLPPKIFLFGLLPTILVIVWLFIFKHRFIDGLPIKPLTYIHLVRIPVEFVLLWLFLEDQIPQIMTFEGWNFDILMGLSTPIIIFFGFIIP
ncbi:MAG: hypothetical protein AAF740_01955, partial [Bacteroidota bacterium]